jgi:uncharacterized protein DUF6941
MQRPLIPYVRHMLLCSNAVTEANNVTIQGLLSTINGETFPYSGGFSVVLSLSEGRRPGEGRIRIVDSDNGEECYLGRPFLIPFENAPLKSYLVTFRVTRCTFPRPGLFTVEFLFENVMIAQESLLLR